MAAEYGPLETNEMLCVFRRGALGKPRDGGGLSDYDPVFDFGGVR